MARRRIIRRNVGTGAEAAVPHPAGTRYRRPSPSGAYRIVDGVGTGNVVTVALTIDRPSGGNPYGFRLGTDPFGAINPTHVLNIPIFGFLTNNLNDEVILEFGGTQDVQLPGVNTINVRFLDAGAPPAIDLPWDGGDDRYQVIDQPLSGYMVLSWGLTRNAVLILRD